MTEELKIAADHIKRIEDEVAQQKEHVRRMIVRGNPTQAAEDRLRQLEATLMRLKG